jgi:broad specificity phosphatase PhoE
MQCIVACAGALLATSALAGDAKLAALLSSLQQGGYVIVMRHGATDDRQEDVYSLDYGDMATQRQLSEQGREVARQIGYALRSLGIPIGRAFTSRLKRAVETGRLIAGKDVVWKEELTDSGMGSASAMAGSSVTGNQRYAAALRELVATRPAFGTNTLIVTHKTNIRDAFGKAWADIKEGESLLFKPESFDTNRTHRAARRSERMDRARTGPASAPLRQSLNKPLGRGSLPCRCPSRNRGLSHP